MNLIFIIYHPMVFNDKIICVHAYMQWNILCKYAYMERLKHVLYALHIYNQYYNYIYIVQSWSVMYIIVYMYVWVHILYVCVCILHTNVANTATIIPHHFIPAESLRHWLAQGLQRHALQSWPCPAGLWGEANSWYPPIKHRNGNAPTNTCFNGKIGNHLNISKNGGFSIAMFDCRRIIRWTFIPQNRSK
jgi:hypothetical protein